jgi:hypothetical protein
MGKQRLSVRNVVLNIPFCRKLVFVKIVSR